MQIVVALMAMEIVKMLQSHMDPKITQNLLQLPWLNFVCEQVAMRWLCTSFFFHRHMKIVVAHSHNTGIKRKQCVWLVFTFLKQVFCPMYTNGFFLLVRYKTLGIVHCTYLGVSGYNLKKKFFCLKIFFTLKLTNCEDMMKCSIMCAAFHLGLHSLHKY